jgi:hypothetical protein
MASDGGSAPNESRVDCHLQMQCIVPAKLVDSSSNELANTGQDMLAEAEEREGINVLKTILFGILIMALMGAVITIVLGGF